MADPASGKIVQRIEVGKYIFDVASLAGNDVVATSHDELLVVRPPTRVVGGVTVQF